MKYVYKNEVGRPINIAGYQFDANGELPSNIPIDRFNEAVSNGFLSVKEIKEDVSVAEPKTGTDEEAKKTAEEEAARKAEEERLAAEAAAAKKAEEDRIAAEAAEAKRIADEEAKKTAEETAKRK